MRKLISFGLTLCFAAMVMGQSKMSPMTRIFMQECQQTDSLSQAQLRRNFVLRTVHQVTYVNAFLHLNEDADLAKIKALGVYIDSDFGNIVTARIPVDKLETLSQLTDVKYVEIGTPVRQAMDKARPAGNVDKAQNGIGLSHAFYGDGVIVGVIDYGFQYDHINFFDMGGHHLRVKRVWDQNNYGTPPTGFSFGRELKDSAAIMYARVDDPHDDVGHGTHVTGIAAGADTFNGNPYYGVASKADIVMVSMSLSDASSDNVSISNGVKYIFDYATSVGKPAVVNMSLGQHVGPHDGTSTFDRVCDGMLTVPGRILVGSAGNEGSDVLHLQKQFFPGNNDTIIKTTIEPSSTYMGEDYGLIDVWGDVNFDYSVRVSIVKTSNAIEEATSGDLHALSGNTKTFVITKGGSGRIYLTSERNTINGKGNVTIDCRRFQGTKTGYRLALVITAKQSGRVHAWASQSTFAKKGVLGYVNGDTYYTVGEIGGSGKQIISVGAYCTRASSYGEHVGALASFSSRGPSADMRLKPDITGPGTYIVSSVPDFVVNGYAYDQAAVNKVNGRNYYYGYMQGTSMSSPYVTGVIALWLEANPNLGPSRVREILAATSINDSYTGSPHPNTQWGYGKINAVGGILKAIQMTGVEQLNKMPDVIMAYPNPNNGAFKMLFTQSDPNLVLNVYSINGQKVYSECLGSVQAREERTFNLGNAVVDGVYIVNVQGEHMAKSFRLIVRK